MSSGFFITGTDTEVGKTRISVGLIEVLKQQGHRVAAMKPVASGCEQTATGLQNEDALALQAAASVRSPYSQLNPYAFAPAIAPHIAALQDGVEINLTNLVTHYQQIAETADVVVVEGAGGWLVPLNRQQTIADLAIALNLPVILVVAIRLGCINHALLTAESVRRSGLTLAGWVANNLTVDPQQENIIAAISERIDAPCLGVVPRLADKSSAADYLMAPVC
ncbi:Dethiobiotin synthetase [Methylophaga frappieri]|uniref:ATP-dependent dethiobiotin synthetase BioD n=1 Tax=Methylophaga frappieri (strain ATCC BAA-2434 / DSM 25690 / JAM7) TaxID=754477 RepID=I1YHS0_METFJ|nr:dethiobiotin synthase [Methylophaga frappieri]AFJ02463.1 Dethiobiotin synthetase [Methylophaga frappieri]